MVHKVMTPEEGRALNQCRSSVQFMFEGNGGDIFPHIAENKYNIAYLEETLLV
jgi:hypothetical protein